MCFNPSPERRVPSPNRYTAEAKLCFCKNNKRMIITKRCGLRAIRTSFQDFVVILYREKTGS